MEGMIFITGSSCRGGGGGGQNTCQYLFSPPGQVYLLVSSLPRSVVMEARGKFEFNATAEDELSFRKGDILKVHKVHSEP
ncbi:hypothetical protein HF521_004996 [Silurus meridionalis]|uniref:SH3 domain-containing protein n=1 Tax=Silurus meridionalis TaxID=175797 RepID=A0A8T0AZV7_SILME|nr:hypothetical protein HF521_004996 [Silurus meridionalis]